MIADDQNMVPAMLDVASRLDGRLAIVTGAASGIGCCIARHLRHAGAALLLVDCNASKLQAICSQIPDATGLVVDLSDWDIEDRLSEALAGRVPDILVNGAGIFPSREVLLIDEPHWNETLDTNLKGAVRIGQIVAKQMVDSGTGGAIVNIASIQGLRPGASKIAYASSKAGLIAATQVMAIEWAAAGVRVNAVAPGPVLTEATRDAIETATGSRRVPPGVATPDEIARVAHFLASPAASFVNGAVWVVDGGACLSVR